MGYTGLATETQDGDVVLLVLMLDNFRGTGPANGHDQLAMFGPENCELYNQ